MKIFITGSTGSGKSTLARIIGQESGDPVISLDDMHWIRKAEGDERRPLDEKIKLLSFAANQESWIIEGVQFRWADIVIEEADLIIVIDLIAYNNYYYIIKRFLKQFINRNQPRHKRTLSYLIQMFRWSSDYRAYERKLLCEKLYKHSDKTIFVTHPIVGLKAFHDRLAQKP